MKVFGKIPAGIIVLSLGVVLLAGWVRAEEKAKEQPKEAVPVVVPLDKALKKVFPELTNKPEAEVIYVDDKTQASKCEFAKDKGCRIYPVKKKDALLGYAVGWTSEEGFKSLIKVLVGITPGGDITGIEVLEQDETPNRGAKIAEDEFLQQFAKKNLQNTKWQIEKEGGDIKAISGASFSSKAVSSAVKEALEFYGRNKDILAKKAK